MNFCLIAGFGGFLYKILTPVEWLQTWIMKIVHDFFVMLGVRPDWCLMGACHYHPGAGGAGLYLPAVLQADEVDAQDAGIGAEDAAYSEQVQRQDGSGFQGAMSRETMKLYQDNDVNPAGSCLPMLIQGRCSCPCSIRCRPFHTLPTVNAMRWARST